jgi:hypothetical protein
VIEPTDEMIQAQAAAFSARMGELLAVGGAFDMADPKRAGLAAVLAIVERDYCLESKGHVYHPPAGPRLCPATTPKLVGSADVRCEFQAGHTGPHRGDTTTWSVW